MDNVVSIFGAKQPEAEEPADPVMEFVTESLMPWAVDNYIDIDSLKFKINAAGIMTMLQGMLLEDV